MGTVGTRCAGGPALPAAALVAVLLSSASVARGQAETGGDEVEAGSTLPWDASGTDLLMPARPTKARGAAGADAEARPAPYDEQARPAPGDARVEVRLSPCLAEVAVLLPPAAAGDLPRPVTALFALPPGAARFEILVSLGGRTLRTGVGEVPPGTPPVIPDERWAPVYVHTVPGARADDEVDARLLYDAPQTARDPGGRVEALADAVIRGPRSHAMVRAHVLRHWRRVVRYCRARREEVISVTFVITARGAVTAAAVSRSTTGDPVADDRVAMAVQTIPFPPLAREGVTVVTYPITLGPDRY